MLNFENTTNAMDLRVYEGETNQLVYFSHKYGENSIITYKIDSITIDRIFNFIYILHLRGVERNKRNIKRARFTTKYLSL